MNTALGGLMAMGAMAAVVGILWPNPAWAHCDTLSGPVVADARKALDTQDVTPVLKWIEPENEEEIRSLFDKTLQARQKGKDVQELVDRHFFETLVRVHRAAEGAPYTGLKSADTPLEPGVEAAEKALDSESDRAVLDALQAELESGLHQRFQRAIEARKHKDESVAAGREYVEACVDYIHYVERLHTLLVGTPAHDEDVQGKDPAETPASKPAAVHPH